MFKQGVITFEERKAIADANSHTLKTSQIFYEKCFAVEQVKVALEAGRKARVMLLAEGRTVRRKQAKEAPQKESASSAVTVATVGLV